MKKLLCKLQSNTAFILLGLWVIATLLNINKAFHIDDVFHLEAAQWIQQNPLTPMSGSINWHDTNEPFHNFNQPPLYFYLVALTGSVWGYSEIPLHLFQSIFTLLSILYFYKLIKLFNSSFALTATALLALSPAFLVNQNLMTDAPILSISIIFIYLILKAEGRHQTKNLYFAALILSIGLLIKYTLLPLLPILVYKVWRTKRKDLVPVVLIPITLIGCWTIFNYIEFGSSHIVGRKGNGLTLDLFSNSAMALVLTLGGLAPFTGIFIQGFFKQVNRSFRRVFIAAIVVLVTLSYLFLYGFFNSTLQHSLFWIVLFTNGLVLIILSTIVCIRAVRNSMYSIIILWGAGIGLFIVLFAPFMATRHVLLLLPPLLIACSSLFSYSSAKTVWLAIFLTASLGFVLSISDWYYADFYRKSALQALSVVPKKSKIWTAGHWGWQWYSKQAGMHFYNSKTSEVKAGDYLIYPANISRQKISEGIHLIKLSSIVYKNHIGNKVTTAQFARFYNSYATSPPWYITSIPTDSVLIYRVTKVEKDKR